MKEFPEVPSDLINAIKTCKKAVVCGHMNPDGDCANSSMAMGLLLKALNKDYILVNEGSFDRPEIEEFGKIVKNEVPSEYLNSDTLGIVVDCSTLDRLGYFSESYRKMTVAVIDHHSSGENFGKYRYIVPDSISTTLLVYNVFKACNVNITEDTARLLFRGFATDSGFFKFIGAKSKPTFEIIADLVDLNVAPNMEYHAVNGNKPFESVKFLAALINRVESFYNGKLMISHEEESDYKDFGDNAHASDDLYAQLLSVKDVKAVFFFKKSKKVDNAVEIGMRASHSSNFNVGEFAKQFGGGGHAKASGCTIKGNYDSVRETVLNAARKYFAD